MIYTRRATPLHAARAGAGVAYCVALGVLALLFDHPVVLGAVLLAVLGAAAASDVGRQVGRTVLLWLPIAVLIVLVNALVSRHGLTVVARLGEVPVFGQIDVTVEALAYGGVLALRALTLVACFALLTLSVDPDEVLRGLRRVGFRSALTATVANRMVPVLARDGRRLAEAQRARGAGRVPRTLVLRAVCAGALERAVDVAAALEVRGFGAARRPGRAARPWSRHDLAFAAAAVALLAGGVAARVAGVVPFDADPFLRVPVGAGVVAAVIVLVGVAALPHLDRRGVVR